MHAAHSLTKVTAARETGLPASIQAVRISCEIAPRGGRSAKISIQGMPQASHSPSFSRSLVEGAGAEGGIAVFTRAGPAAAWSSM